MRKSSRTSVGREDPLRRAVAQALEGRVLLSTTWTVTSTADDGSLGTLRYAVNNSAPGDTIQFSPALAAGNGSAITLNGTALVVTHAVSIVGPRSDLLTILAGQQSSIFTVSANVSISGVELLGGSATNGGIIDATSGSLTLANMLISGSKATNQGGAIYAATSSLTMNHVQVQYGTAMQGGAVYLASGTALLTNVILNNHTASSDTTPRGGALFMAAGTSATITASIVNVNNTFASSSASGPGGAIYSSGTLTIQNSTLGGNYTTGDSFTSPGGAV